MERRQRPSGPRAVTEASDLAVVGLAAVFILATSAFAEQPRTLTGAGPALVLEVSGPEGPSETFLSPPSLVDALRETTFEDTVRLADWPVAPGDRRTVEITRHDVYAPDARVIAIGAGGEREVPRSRLLFFWGTAVGDSSHRVLVSLDPDGGTLGGLGVTPDGVWEVRPVRFGAPGEYRIASLNEPLLASEGGTQEPGPGFVCGGSPTHPEDWAAASSESGDGATTSVLSSLHTATVAVDTDNELLSLKFGDSTASATSYIASLVAGMNVIYERDLFLRLLQGHTLLRLSSSPDPWTQPSCPAWPASCQTGGASGPQLSEFSSYWASNYAAVPRALTMMLSGKQSNDYSASGIAWVNGLCSGSYGYSFSQVFKFSGSSPSNDVKLASHELGHNFGSHHTHCQPTATTPIDKCYSGEWGCYSGPTSCPSPFTIDPVNGEPESNVRGTLMSYCHLLGGCEARPIFHPQAVDVIAPIVDSRVNVCVFPDSGAPPPTISGVTPGTGLTVGGTTVTITGSGFQSGATVAFVDATRAAAASSLTFVNSTTLTATTPPHAAGTTDVVVGSPSRRTATRRGAFTFAAPAGGAQVSGSKTVSGTFTPGGAITYTIVLWNTRASTQPDVAGSHELSDVVPSSLTLVSANATSGSATATVATNTVTWNGAIASGGSVTVTIQATVKPTTVAETVVSNQGTVRYDGDGNGTNESSTPTDDPSRPGTADATTFRVGLGLYTSTPCRLVDTRAGDGPALAAGAVRTFTLVGRCGLPAGAKSLSLNVTVVAGSAPGNVVVYPGNLSAPLASTVNFTPGLTRANNAIVGLATNGAGTVAVRNHAAAAVHLILDVNGYFR
jgi:uncharacterized repeat protein (TIGR01451 family)